MQVTSARPTVRSALDTRATTEPAEVSGRPEPGPRRLSLLWWAFLPNVVVLLVAFLLLAFTPITISAPISIGQLVLLLTGLMALLALNLVLLRRVLSPLFNLTALMTTIDPDSPGRRVSLADLRSAEGTALAEAFNDMLDRLETARRKAARTALAAQEAERLRVARELHDEIGQTLTAVTLQAERAAGGDPLRASEELMRVADAVRESLDEVRRIARELRPEALDDLGLINALIALCSRVDAQGGPRIRRKLQPNLPPLGRDVELVMYRVVQESLTNAVRHADADTVTVSLMVSKETVTVSIADDGKGLPDQVPSDTAGFAGMRERALLVEGRLSIESQQDKGTEVRLTVPLHGVSA